MQELPCPRSDKCVHLSGLLTSRSRRPVWQTRVVSAGGGVGWVDPGDVGAVAAHVLTPDGHEGATYAVTGPEVLTHAPLAERLTRTVGRPVAYVDVPAEQFA